MQLEIQKFLFDILTSINSIEEFLGNKRDFNVYKSNKLLRRGVERELEIIGEAASRILKIDPHIPIENIKSLLICVILSYMDMIKLMMRLSGESYHVICLELKSRSKNY